MPGTMSNIAKAAVSSALALVIVVGTMPAPAQAKGGDITRGLLLGLVGGYAADQFIQHQRAAQASPVTTYPTYDNQAAPVYYQQTAPAAPHYSQSSPDSRAFNSEDRQLRIAIQYNLMQQGLYNGALDGVWGPATENAVYSYARSHGQVSMLATEEESRQLFASILR